MIREQTEARPSADLLSFIADDRAVVIYRPRWNTFTGGMAQTVLLQQIIYWWIKNGRRPFYKFARPCAHRLYRPGDSWEEELSVQRREFENARGGVSARTHGQLDPTALVSYWTDAQRVTWYALNESLLLDHLAALYPPADVGLQLPLPDLMDETSIRSNGRNVHQPSPAAEELMDETSIRTNVPNVHLLMDETYIGSNGRNVHPLITENKTTSETTPQTPPAAAAAEPPATPLPAAAAAADPLQPILDWIGFDDTLQPKERAGMTVSDLLGWAYWARLKQAEPGSRIVNPVGWMRSQWRGGRPLRADILRLARGWLLLDDDGRANLLDRLEWANDYDGHADSDFERDFPDIPPALAAAVHTATGGVLGPPSLMPPPPPPADPREPRRAAHVAPRPPVPQATILWRDALDELEMQMTKAVFTAYLHGTTAYLDGDELTVHVRSPYAAAHLAERLHDLVTRTVNARAGRPITVTYEAPAAQPEVQHG